MLVWEYGIRDQWFSEEWEGKVCKLFRIVIFED